jgi:acetylornithine deacetylase
MTTADALALIEKLVSFDTTSRDSNLALIDFVAGYLKRFGIESAVLRSPDGNKANLYATIGPRERGGIVLSGHTDVVPVDGQPWSTDPFAVTRKNGRLYGRGTADMKSFIAAVLAKVPDFADRPLATPIHLAFSYDEEVGCRGVHGIIDHIRAAGPRPLLAIVGEPTEMKVVNAHKGVLGLNTRVTGLEAHSSNTHLGVNAVMIAAELVTRIARYAADLTVPARRNERFAPPHTTVQVGVIQGGTARNIIARQCQFLWETRALPGTDPTEVYRRFEQAVADEVVPAMKAVHAGCGVVTEITAQVPALAPQASSPAETLALKLAGSNQTFAVSYGTEAGIFQEFGVPTIVCGPGNIREAHKPDEFIEVAQVEACLAFLGRLLDHARGG